MDALEAFTIEWNKMSVALAPTGIWKHQEGPLVADSLTFNALFRERKEKDQPSHLSINPEALDLFNWLKNHKR